MKPLAPKCPKHGDYGIDATCRGCADAGAEMRRVYRVLLVEFAPIDDTETEETLP